MRDAPIKQQYYDLYKLHAKTRGFQPIGDIDSFYAQLKSGSISRGDLPLYWVTQADTKTRKLLYHIFRSTSCSFVYCLHLNGDIWHGTSAENGLPYTAYSDFERTQFILKYENHSELRNLVTYADGTTEFCFDIKLPEAQEQLKALEGWEHLDRVFSCRPKTGGCSLKLRRSSPLLADIFGR